MSCYYTAADLVLHALDKLCHHGIGWAVQKSNSNFSGDVTKFQFDPFRCPDDK